MIFRKAVYGERQTAKLTVVTEPLGCGSLAKAELPKEGSKRNKSVTWLVEKTADDAGAPGGSRSAILKMGFELRNSDWSGAFGHQVHPV